MSNKHTPGPWKLFRVYSDTEIRNETDELIAVAICGSDARLIAAAPDLLEAAQKVLSNKHGEDDWLILAVHCQDLAAAIAKATGRAS